MLGVCSSLWIMTVFLPYDHQRLKKFVQTNRPPDRAPRALQSQCYVLYTVEFEYMFFGLRAKLNF